MGEKKPQPIVASNVYEAASIEARDKKAFTPESQNKLCDALKTKVEEDIKTEILDLQRHIPFREVQRGDTLSAIILGMKKGEALGEKIGNVYNLKVEFRKSGKEFENMLTKNLSNIYPGQKVWVEGGKIIVGETNDVPQSSPEVKPENDVVVAEMPINTTLSADTKLAEDIKGEKADAIEKATPVKIQKGEDKIKTTIDQQALKKAAEKTLEAAKTNLKKSAEEIVIFLQAESKDWNEIERKASEALSKLTNFKDTALSELKEVKINDPNGKEVSAYAYLEKVIADIASLPDDVKNAAPSSESQEVPSLNIPKLVTELSQAEKTQAEDRVAGKKASEKKKDRDEEIKIVPPTEEVELAAKKVQPEVKLPEEKEKKPVVQSPSAPVAKEDLSKAAPTKVGKVDQQAPTEVKAESPNDTLTKENVSGWLRLSKHDEALKILLTATRKLDKKVTEIKTRRAGENLMVRIRFKDGKELKFETSATKGLNVAAAEIAKEMLEKEEMSTTIAEENKESVKETTEQDREKLLKEMDVPESDWEDIKSLTGDEINSWFKREVGLMLNIGMNDVAAFKEWLKTKKGRVWQSSGKTLEEWVKSGDYGKAL